MKGAGARWPTCGMDIAAAQEILGRNGKIDHASI